MLVPPLLAAATDIPPLLIVPFGLLLVLIAAMPLTPPRVKHVWEHYYPHIALALGALVGAYYLLQIPAGGGVIVHTAHEYVSFITLIGALFVVAGGIHIKVKGEATPGGNVAFLAVGAVIANFIGTTGASMVLIRPWIRMNKIRSSAYHVVFFIFIVANIGGALTPIGDPPLFLGFLRGVPFFWLVEQVMVQWLVTLGLVLAAFYVLDRRSFRRMPALNARRNRQGCDRALVTEARRPNSRGCSVPRTDAIAFAVCHHRHGSAARRRHSFRTGRHPRRQR